MPIECPFCGLRNALYAVTETPFLRSLFPTMHTKSAKKRDNTCIYHKKAVPLQRQRYQDNGKKNPEVQVRMAEQRTPKYRYGWRNKELQSTGTDGGKKNPEVRVQIPKQAIETRQ